MVSKTAIVTGVTGQDGAYMAALLLEKGYKVFATYRRTSSTNFWRIASLGIAQHKNLSLLEHDITDAGDCYRLILQTQPDEIYNLAAQSFVHVSFNQPSTTAQITALGTLNMLEAIRNINPTIRFYQASTSELYGMVQEIPQSETTPFYPRSPYAAAKLYAHWITVNYRESYNIFGCSGILFNHESPLRGLDFVTRKTTDQVARIKLGLSQQLRLGNLDAKRDWGYAKEYVVGMYLMLQTEQPDNYVLATGKTQTVRDFVTMAFAAIEIDIQWQGDGVDEIGIDTKTGQTLVVVDKALYRPTEVDILIGDPTKAQTELGWQTNTTLAQLCQMMVESDIDKVQQGAVF